VPANNLLERIEVLHGSSAVEPIYDEAVLGWPRGVSIWDSLESPVARREFVRYLVARDETDLRAYTSFANLCTGFAVQLYARLSSRSGLSLGATVRLSEAASISITPTEPKLRVPLFVAISGAHAYCAFLLEEEADSEFASYLLYEPQNDAFIEPEHPAWDKYVATFGVKFNDLADFTAGGRFEFVPRHCFVCSRGGAMRRVSSERVASLARDFAIAETPKSNYDAYVVGGFSEFIRARVALWKPSDAELLELAGVLVGRPLRTELGGEVEVLTASRYLSLLGRLDLRSRGVV